jgi:thioredoxin-like negative regulator of GroEL
MPTITLPKAVLHLLTDIAVIGGQNKESDQSLIIFKLLAEKLPNVPQVAVGQALQLFHRGHYRVARDLLETTEAAHPKCTSLKSVMALVLFAQKDSLWQAYAQEVKTLNDDEDALKMVTLIEQFASGDHESLIQLADEGDAEGQNQKDATDSSGSTAHQLPNFGIVC